LLKEQLDQSIKELNAVNENNKDLLVQLEKERAKAQQLEQHVINLEATQQKDLAKLSKERDSARDKMLELHGKQKSAKMDVQMQQTLKLELKDKVKEIQTRDVEIADLVAQVNQLEARLQLSNKSSVQKQNHGASNVKIQSEVLQEQSVFAPSKTEMTLLLAKKENTISDLQQEVNKLQEQLSAAQSCGINSPAMDNFGGGVSLVLYVVDYF